MAAIKIASSLEWGQLWTDATTKRQIPFTVLIVGLLGNNTNLDPVVISSCIFMEDERSQLQADGIVKKVNALCV